MRRGNKTLEHTTILSACGTHLWVYRGLKSKLAASPIEDQFKKARPHLPDAFFKTVCTPGRLLPCTCLQKTNAPAWRPGILFIYQTMQYAAYCIYWETILNNTSVSNSLWDIYIDNYRRIWYFVCGKKRCLARMGTDGTRKRSWFKSRDKHSVSQALTVDSSLSGQFHCCRQHWKVATHSVFV